MRLLATSPESWKCLYFLDAYQIFVMIGDRSPYIKTSLFIVWEVGKQGTIFGNANLANIKKYILYNIIGTL